MVRDPKNDKSPAKTPRNAVAVRFDGLTEGLTDGKTRGMFRKLKQVPPEGGSGVGTSREGVFCEVAAVAFFPDFSDLKA